MSTNDDQQFLNEQLRQATESEDPQAEIGLVLLHYHQAMLDAVQTLHPCDVCRTTIDLAQLQAIALEIKRGNYTSYQELQRVARERLDMAKLCTECKQQFKGKILEVFVQIHKGSQ